MSNIGMEDKCLDLTNSKRYCFEIKAFHFFFQLLYIGQDKILSISHNI